MIWTEMHDQRFRYLANEYHLAAVAREMGIPSYTAWKHARRLKVKPLYRSETWTPTEGEWIGAATQAALEAGIYPQWVLGTGSTRRVSRARWKAWKMLLDSNPDFTLAGVGRASGYDHTSVRYGLRRLAQMEAAGG